MKGLHMGLFSIFIWQDAQSLSIIEAAFLDGLEQRLPYFLGQIKLLFLEPRVLPFHSTGQRGEGFPVRNLL